MKTTARLLCTLIAAAGFASAASAHHSFTATYDETGKLRIEGEIAQFLFRNPHSMIHVTAPGPDGMVHRWAIEWAGVSALSGNGVTRETLRIGDHVVVTGNPGRNPEEYRLRLLSIDRPSDGWSWKGSFE
ncbi:MAG TPA: DUF6152 family protein [Gammaproteobacteria bacterium]|jgi:hypothetical protein|nr:DUF6152 family protein [Gammaproteobacteria bacterium]